jgi:hypothetical protein
MPMRLNLTTVGDGDPALRKALADITRRFRDRLRRNTRLMAVRPPVRVRHALAAKVGRGTVLDSICSPS